MIHNKRIRLIVINQTFNWSKFHTAENPRW